MSDLESDHLAHCIDQSVLAFSAAVVLPCHHPLISLMTVGAVSRQQWLEFTLSALSPPFKMPFIFFNFLVSDPLCLSSSLALRVFRL
jgi:hypothetical protein